MDFYSVLALLVFIALVLALYFIRKRKEYKYTLLDVAGIIFNVVLGVMVYPPLSVAGMMFGIDRFAQQPLQIALESITIAMGNLMPAVCVAGIGASVVLRRKEKRVPGFLIQFVGLIFFGLTLLIGKLSGSY